MKKTFPLVLLLGILSFLAVVSAKTSSAAATRLASGPEPRALAASAGEGILRAARSLTNTVQYTVTDLGTLGSHSRAYAINEAGQVVGGTGVANTEPPEIHAFLWEEGNMTDLGTLGGQYSSAHDINDNGQIVGYARDANQVERAVLWEDGTSTVLHSGDNQSSYAHGINSAGQIAGSAFFESADDELERHAVLWQGGTMSDLGMLGDSTRALDINESGRVVGYYSSSGGVDGGTYGFSWADGVMAGVDVDFGGGNTTIWGNNAAGDLVGHSRTDGGQFHAFLKRDDGPVTHLHPVGMNGHSKANAINNAGQVVGYAGTLGAVIWQNGTTIALNDLIQPDSGWDLQEAHDINDSGQIVGNGTFNGERRAFLLTPEQTPWTVMFYLDGDNNLDHTYSPIFNQLEAAADNANVEVVAVWDRLAGPSAYYHIQHDTDLNALGDYVEGETKWSQGELNMGTPTTLSDFAIWAMNQFPARHYALILDDHGSGLGGGLVDDTSNRKMNLPEMQLALATIHEQTGEKIDVLFMAMCLMGMIEDAFQFRQHADYYVANQHLQWAFTEPYDDYVAGIGQTSSPAEVAQLFAGSYADVGDAKGKSYTISVVDMAQMEPLVAATQRLSFELHWSMEEISPTLTSVLTDVQRFDNKSPRGITLADTSIDLYHFADLLSLNLLSYGDIVIASTALMSAVDDAVIYERHAGSGSTALDNSHGIAVFFPATSSSFYEADNYDFAVGADWGNERTVVLSQEEGSWGTMLVEYIRQVNPDGPDDPTPPEPVVKLLPSSSLFIPVLMR